MTHINIQQQGASKAHKHLLPSSIIKYYTQAFSKYILEFAYVAKQYLPIIGQLEQLNIKILFVDECTSKDLNASWLGNDYPTNIITLEDDAKNIHNPYLTIELFICVDVLIKEAQTQQKSVLDHSLHLLLHGLLHGFGLDHELSAKDCEHMENLEISILSHFGFVNPYL